MASVAVTCCLCLAGCGAAPGNNTSGNATSSSQGSRTPSEPAEVKTYVATGSGSWGSVSGYGCTWQLSFEVEFTIDLGPQASDGGQAVGRLDSHWRGACEPYDFGNPLPEMEVTRTTDLFSATWDEEMVNDEHPLRVELQGNKAGSTPFGTAKVRVTWEPEVEPQTTEKTVQLSFREF